MVRIISSQRFIKEVRRLTPFERHKLEKQIRKILENAQVGKPLKYKRGERSLYVRPFRLVYAIRNQDVILLKFEHRKNVYKGG